MTDKNKGLAAGLVERINELALRERLLLLLVIVVISVLAADALWLGPTQRSIVSETQRLERLDTQQQALMTRLNALNAEAAADPNAQLRARLEALRAEVMDLDEALVARTLAFVSPQRMPGLLEDLIRGSEGLSLLGMHSEPATRVEALATGEGLPPVYRHGLVMELQGDYLALLAYLRAVEELPWGLFWESLSIDTEAATPGRFRIRVFTLSLEEGWIGV
jgi:MSHA biogenesis protein MshJ